MMHGEEMQQAMKVLAQLPGLGQRSARRALLHLLIHKDRKMAPLIQALKTCYETIHPCAQCGNLDTVNPCHLCQSPRRHRYQLCIVESVSDLWAMERTGTYHGLYHVLGGVLSAMDNVQPEDLGIPRLIERVHALNVEEVIFALSASLEAQTTTFVITESLPKSLKTTQLAHGIPIGGELDYMDDATLQTALQRRGVLQGVG
jgi:recombination protein RecR